MREADLLARMLACGCSLAVGHVSIQSGAEEALLGWKTNGAAMLPAETEHLRGCVDMHVFRFSLTC